MTIAEFLAGPLPQASALNYAARTVRQLLAHRLNCDPAALHAHPDREIPSEILARLQTDLDQLAKGRPAAHVFGSVPFLDWTFKCDERALIPRPETEALCYLVIQRYAGKQPPRRVLDLCCGSGVLGLSLASAFPETTVVLTDLCPEALSLCEENKNLLGLGDRVRLLRGDLWDALPDDTEPFDLIVANPPYVAADDPVEASVLQWEPRHALYSDEDGLAHLKRILDGLARFLAPGGTAAFELGHHHAEMLGSRPTAPGLSRLGALARDPFNVPRFLIFDESKPGTPMGP
ncbi:MAG: peptide chain release factor N(5)-glutamine methyltransferase [Acidobacteriota bacterium]|nr:peptide chain release factor N(5)-glutamine methyltransferase [Acidobacteriota bacterium]